MIESPFLIGETKPSLSRMYVVVAVIAMIMIVRSHVTIRNTETKPGTSSELGHLS